MIADMISKSKFLAWHCLFRCATASCKCSRPVNSYALNKKLIIMWMHMRSVFQSKLEMRPLVSNSFWINLQNI
ncbi:uncharacterized protein BYT42DRAFT_188545 [Radiomyces spectabilis]|uniref:uncharacterized protein n=1 Tax=Radiomyces spectabilis TaxID=64574 RepID=UPI00221FB1BF|nr:uncharacterized protein BYT42DRAFT_188545 [Radiomyces spectabilis]KAI8391278.1 hypothetical protein BYT42DRAFT_188545 [Radiomyces spectabilis]